MDPSDRSPADPPPAVTEPAAPREFDLRALAAACTEAWNVIPLGDANDVSLSLAVIQGVYFSHHHPDDDEVFLVIEGRLLVHLDDRTVELLPGQGLIVPRGVDHLSEAPERTLVYNVKGVTGTTVRA